MDVIKKDGDTYVFDVVRKTYVSLTKEELVRQKFIDYLISDLGYPTSVIAVERSLYYAKNKRKRFDLVVFKSGDPFILVEFKAFDIKLTVESFQQLATYNRVLNAEYLVLFNGGQLRSYKLDIDKQELNLIEDLPSYSTLG